MRWIIRFLHLCTIAICTYVLFYYDNTSIVINQKDCYMLNEVSEYCVVKPLSENTFKCDISCVSNIINNLILDNWGLTKLEETEEHIDAIFEKEGVVYRVYYDSTGTLTFITAPYENRKDVESYMYGRDRK